MAYNKTIAELIDELSIVNIKIFMEMEHGNDLQRVKSLNRGRSDLKNAINEYFAEDRRELKTYE